MDRLTYSSLAIFTIVILICVWGKGGWVLERGWTPLPTNPQRYGDPASLVFAKIEWKTSTIGTVTKYWGKVVVFTIYPALQVQTNDPWVFLHPCAFLQTLFVFVLHSFISSQDFMSPFNWYPTRQAQSNPSSLLIHFWAHPWFVIRHSLTSTHRLPTNTLLKKREATTYTMLEDIFFILLCQYARRDWSIIA